MKHGIILMNLGTPAAPTPSAIRQYLREFLSDPRVVEVPRLLWLPILYGPILTFRPRKVAAGYQMMWQEYGESPLRLISRRQVTAVRDRLQKLLGEAAPAVALAMTYGAPTLASAVEELRAAGCDQLLVLPLYPQYSATTTGPIFDQIAAITRAARDIPSIHIVKQYCDHPLYIAALARAVQLHWQEKGRGDRLLMSFHGIPQRNVDRGDPYWRQCQATGRALADALGLHQSEWSMSFQSRLGRAQWLQPYTSETLRSWGREKVARIDVVCPAFAADCLETLEEIAVENKVIFQEAGGGDYRYIPCLNDAGSHIDLIVALISEQMPGLSIAQRQLMHVELPPSAAT